MSALTDYRQYSKVSSQKQTALQSLEAGFFPFLPFSFQYSLKLQEKVLLAADLKKQDNFKQFMSRYDIEEDGVSNSLATTVGQTGGIGINKQGSEFGRRLSGVVTEQGREVSRKTEVRQDYTGEIASEAIAVDIIEQLKKEDSLFGGDMSKVEGDIDKELLKFNQQYLDKNPQTKQSREILDFYLQVLNQYAGIDTEGVLGIEETVGLRKNITREVGLLEGNESEEQVFKLFKKGLEKESADMNNIIQGTTGTDFLSARDQIPARVPGDSLAQSHNQFARQILSRFHEMTVYNQHEGLKGDKYIYTAPLGAPSGTNPSEVDRRARYMGLYTIMPKNINGKMGVQMIPLRVIEMQGAVFATLDNFILQQQGTHSGILSKVEFDKIEDISQQIANERALDLLETDSLGMEAGNLNEAIVGRSIEGAVSVARVMSSKEISDNILQSFNNYAEGKQMEVSKIIEDMIKESNKMSKSWKRATANTLDYEPENRFDWKKSIGMGTDDGVWQSGMKSPWQGGDGTGLSISPYLAADRFLSKDYPSLFSKRKVPAFIRKQQRAKRFFR